MKKYIDECQKDDFIAQISFLGGDDCENPEETDVKLHLFRLGKNQHQEEKNNSTSFQKNTEPTDLLLATAKSTFNITKIWSKEFGHISMPEGSWHGWRQTNPNYSPKAPCYKSSLHRFGAKNRVIFGVSL